MNVLLRMTLALVTGLVCSPVWIYGAKAEAPETVIKRSLAAQTTTTVKLPAIDYTQDARIPIPSFSIKEGDALSKMPAFFLGAMNKDLSPEAFGDLTFGEAPGLGRLPIEELKKIQGFEIGKIDNPAEGKSLQELVPGLETLKLSELGLDKAKLSAIDFTKAVGDLPVTIADLGGAGISLDKIVETGTAKDPSAKLIKLDKIDTRQKKGNKITSGSNREPVQKCGQDCDLAEFQSATVKDNTNGIQAVINRPNTPKLPGGVGFFGQLISDAAGGEWGGYTVISEESNMKYSFHQANAKKGSTTGQLNFRFCWDAWGFGKQCTGYFLPVPIAQNTEKGNTVIPFPLLVNAPAAKTPTPTLGAQVPKVTEKATTFLAGNTAPTQETTKSLDKATIFGANVKQSESLVYGTEL